MAYRKIEEIKVNGNSGEIFNSYIYGCNLELGFSESPTKLTLNIVKKDSSDFDSFPNSLLTSYSIEVGSLKLSKMYLYSYEISRTVGQKVATLNFLDGSFILDKIFVGLIHRHGAGGVGSRTAFDVPALCVSCDGNLQFEKTANVFRDLSANELKVNVDLKLGGSIILGQEQFVEGQCDIPDVAYNFTLLLEGMNKAGLSVSNLADINPNYYQSYVGTLREVLSNWCADFGYTFYWDFITNTIKGINLKIEVDYIKDIKDIIKTNSSLNVNSTGNNTLAIESFNENESLEGTVTQKFISRYLKPFRPKSTSSTQIVTRSFTAIKPEKFDISPSDITRAVLAKYNENLRTIYCLQNLDNGYQEYLGLSALSSVEEIGKTQTKNNFFTKVFDYGYNNNAITQFIQNNNGAQIFVALYDPQLAQGYLTWESAIADMIGKYYQGDVEPLPEYQTCKDTLLSQRNVTITPEAQIYTDKNKYDLPFSQVIIGPRPNDGVPWDIPTLYLFSRDTTYGTTQSDYDAKMLDSSGNDPFSAFIPQYLPVEGLAYSRLNAAKIEAERNGDATTAFQLGTIISNVDFLKGQEGEKKVVFVFIPPKEVLKKLLSLAWKQEINRLEISKEEKEDELPECTIKCEGDIIQEVCGKCVDQPQPYVGLRNSLARCLQVTSLTVGKGINLILPSEGNYSGYETRTINNRITIPGQKLVFGEIGAADQNTLSLQVAEADITNDLDPTDGSQVINMFVPDGTGKFKKLTPAAYHADLSQKLINSITLPRKNISLSIIGLNFGELANFITPEKGLTSFSLNLNENGITSQINFANRPKILPKREAISQKIAPTIKLNTYRSK